jgi:glycine cleavage system H protein
MNILKILYTKDHEWIKAEGGEALIGVTDSPRMNWGCRNTEVETRESDKEETFERLKVKTVSDMFMRYW